MYGAQQLKSLSYKNLVPYDAFGNVVDNDLLLPGPDVLPDTEMQDVKEWQEELFKPTRLLLTTLTDEIERNKGDSWVFEYIMDQNGQKIAANVLCTDGIRTKLHQRAFLMSDNNPRLDDWKMYVWRHVYPNLAAWNWNNNDLCQDADYTFPPEWELQEPEYFETKMVQGVQVTNSKLEANSEQGQQLDARVMQNLENILHDNLDESIDGNVNPPKPAELPQHQSKREMEEFRENFADDKID